MQLSEMIKKGTYVGIRFSQDDVDKIYSKILDENIPNPIAKEEIHSTLIYSRKQFNYKEKELVDEWAYPNKLHIFKSKDDKKILVLLLKSDYLKKRHSYLMKKYNATHDFDEFIPHITLSYDFEGTIPKIEFQKEFHISTEYSEDLDLNKYSEQ